MADELVIENKRVPKEAALIELQRIEKKEGFITPSAVVQEAQDERSLLHPLFEWNDGIAGEKFRLFQARLLINSFRVEIKENSSLPQFVNVRVNPADDASRAYINITKALSDEDMKRQVIQTASRELKYWTKKYENVTELVELIDTKKLDALGT